MSKEQKSKLKKLPQFKPSDIKVNEFFPQETKVVNGKISYGRVIQIPEQFTDKGLETLYQILENDDIAGRTDDGLGRRQALFVKSLYLKKGIELPDVGESRIEVMNFLVKVQGIIGNHKAKAETKPPNKVVQRRYLEAREAYEATLELAKQNYKELTGDEQEIWRYAKEHLEIKDFAGKDYVVPSFKTSINYQNAGKPKCKSTDFSLM